MTKEITKQREERLKKQEVSRYFQSQLRQVAPSKLAANHALLFLQLVSLLFVKKYLEDLTR
jgi:hypothetical protein